MSRSIRRKLILTYISLTAIMILFIGVYLSIIIYHDYLENIEEGLKANAILTREIFQKEFIDGPVDLEGLRVKIQNLSSELGARLTLIDASGKVIADSKEDAKNMNNHLMRPEIQDAIIEDYGMMTRYSATLNQDMKYIAIAVRDKEELIGFIRLALPLSQVKEALIKTRWAIIRSGLICVFFTLIFGSLMARTISKPLIEISKVANAIGQGDLTRKIRVRGDDEISHLGHSINQMATDLKNMVDEISHEKSKIEAIVGNMADGVIAVDDNGIVILLNAATETFFGISSKWAMGKHILEVIRNHDLTKALIDVLGREEETIVEVRSFTPVQRTLLCHVTAIAGSTGRGAVAVLQDITEIRRLERMRSEFVSNVSHELRTPVTSIKGFVETLLDGAMSDPQTLEHFLRIIQRESDRLVRLLTDLLHLSQIESKDTQVILIPTDLAEVIEDSIAVINGRAKEKGVRVEVDIPEELPLVMADSDMLRQVFINLMDNGVKYTPAGGIVRVYAGVIDNSTRVEVRVSDNGMGIPQEHLSRIFERFYRVDKARSRQMGGTGLGLAIVKHIIERHGDKIIVKSCEGEGTEFIFTLLIQ